MTWEQAWQEERTGWDAGAPAPALLEYLEQEAYADKPEPGRDHALVPGCGSGYDVFALAQYGYEATGIDLAPTAVKRFETLREQRGLGEARARIALRDFFEFSRDDAHQSAYDLIWDYTFLCAIQPSQRADWAEAMARLVRPGGVLLTLLFPIRDFDDPSPTLDTDPGPPFRLHLEHARRILTPDAFSLEGVHTPQASHPGREGMEQLAIWRRVDDARAREDDR